MDLRIATIAERPAMKSRFVSKETEPWPAFMNQDPIAWLYFSDVRIAHPEYGLIAYDAGTRTKRSPGRSACLSPGTATRLSASCRPTAGMA